MPPDFKKPVMDVEGKKLTLREMAERRLHHGNGRFRNPFAEDDRRILTRVLYWKLFAQNPYASLYKNERRVPVRVDWPAVKQAKGLSITYLKHACLLIKDRGAHLLIDPVFYGLPGFIRDFTPFDFDPRKIPSPDHVLITHGHYDHLDKRTLAGLGKKAHLIAPLGYQRLFSDLKTKNITALDWYGSFSTDGRRITLLPCRHWSMRNPVTGPDRSLWGSYLIETASGPTLYIAGDTAFFEGFEEIGRDYPIDLAIFNLGAYAPRWVMAQSHMNPKETVRAFELVGAKKLMIVHWGSFRLGDEPVYLPPIDLERELEKKGLMKKWVQIRHGQTVDVEKALAD